MGWLGRFMAPPIDQLKKDLGLSDEQAEKIKVQLDQFSEAMRARFDEMRQNGFQGLDWQEEAKKFQELVAGLGDKIKQHLSDEQKEKLDKLFQERFNRFGAGGAPPRGTETGRPARPSAEERIKAVMSALKIEEAEDAAAVRADVKKVVEAQYALEDYERESRTKLDELAKQGDAGEDAIKAKLEELRTGRKEREKALREAQKALAEIVSFKQELELIRNGILR